MLVLFDHGTPKGLSVALSGHAVHTAQSKGWATLSNGALLNAAEGAGFEVLLTTDRRIRYQQDLTARRIALVVLTGSTKWSLVRQLPTASLRPLLRRPLAATRKSRSHSSPSRVGVERHRIVAGIGLPLGTSDAWPSPVDIDLPLATG